MKVCYPSYYPNFRCIAGACPDSCCQQWDVQVDEETARIYRAMPGELGQALRQRLYDEEGQTYLANDADRCPMWREDGLCRIQAELGHGALCQVCQEFPRITQDYGEFVELGLEMSCPEAAQMLLSDEPWHLVWEEKPGGEAPEYDEEWMTLLTATRPGALELLGRRDIPVSERLAELLCYGYLVQAQIDGGEQLDFHLGQGAQLLERCRGLGKGEMLVEFYQNLEILTPAWSHRLACARKSPRWEEELCRLAQYQIYRYYYQAVSDGDLAARIKFIVAGCILLAHLPGEPVEKIQQYAKEIENDAQNVDDILDGAFSHRAFTDENLLGLLAD